MSDPPSGFATLSGALEVLQDKLVDVIGVVVHSTSPATTARGDRSITVRLNDPGLRRKGKPREGLTTRFFGRDDSELPASPAVGDVFLVRRAKKWDRFGGILISNRGTTTTTIPSAALTGKSRSLVFERLSGDVQAYVKQLYNDMADFITTIKDEAKIDQNPCIFGRKFKLISRIRVGDYADLVVEVVKMFYTTGFRNKMELYVTDYTENRDLWLYDPPEESPQQEDGYEGDPYKYQKLPKKEWVGPWGQRVLKVNAFEPHAAMASTFVKPGYLIHLHNVKITSNKETGKVEGDMWQDDVDKHQVNVGLMKYPPKLDAPETKAVLERKQKYWYDRERKLKQSTKEATMQADDAVQQEAVHPVEALTDTPKAEISKASRKKKQNKKKNKKKKQAAKETELQPAGGQTPGEASGFGQRDTSMDDAGPGKSAKTVETKTSDAPERTKPSKAVDIAGEGEPSKVVGDKNPHIRCANEKATVISITTVLDKKNERHMSTNHAGKPFVLPFVNAKYRVKVRVVDFEPKNLLEFALPIRPGEDGYDGAKAKMPGEIQYQWYFELLLEDATTPLSVKTKRDRLWANVQHKDAKLLLGKDLGDPGTLSSNPQQVAKLREKLCILWGNLEEKTEDEPLKNLSFDTTLFEYGYQLQDDEPDKHKYLFGFQKMFNMFETMII